MVWLIWVPSFLFYFVDFCTLSWCGLSWVPWFWFYFDVFVFSRGVGCVGFRSFGSTFWILYSVVVWVVLGSMFFGVTLLCWVFFRMVVFVYFPTFSVFFVCLVFCPVFCIFCIFLLLFFIFLLCFH